MALPPVSPARLGTALDPYFMNLRRGLGEELLDSYLVLGAYSAAAIFRPDDLSDETAMSMPHLNVRIPGRR